MCHVHNYGTQLAGVCTNCGHSMADGNEHGPDQNDFYIDDNDEVQLRSTCTYCVHCNPRLKALKSNSKS